MRVLAVALGGILLGCAPRVHLRDESFVLEENLRENTAPLPPIESIEIHRTRKGNIARAELEQTLAAGVGNFLRALDVEPALNHGQFMGWAIEHFDNPWVDLVPGDIVTSVNGARIETPPQVQLLWMDLHEANTIVVSVVRGDTSFELQFDIQGAAQSEAP